MSFCFVMYNIAPMCVYVYVKLKECLWAACDHRGQVLLVKVIEQRTLWLNCYFQLLLYVLVTTLSSVSHMCVCVHMNARS